MCTEQELCLFGWNAVEWTAIGNVVIGLGTIAMAVAAFATFRTQNSVERLQKRLNWLTASLESHSALQMRLEAEKAGKPAVWWDPTHAGAGKKHYPTEPRHMANARVDTAHIFVPERLRWRPDAE